MAYNTLATERNLRGASAGPLSNNHIQLSTDNFTANCLKIEYGNDADWALEYKVGVASW